MDICDALSYFTLDIDKNETTMVEALLEFGPLSALLDADTLRKLLPNINIICKNSVDVLLNLQLSCQ